MAVTPPARRRVLVLRGHHVAPWEIRQWEPLLDRFDVVWAHPERNAFDVGATTVPLVRVRTRHDRLPSGRLGALAARVLPDRYRDVESLFATADVVHAQELTNWYTLQAARLRRRFGFRLVVTVWETIPFLDAYRPPPAAAIRRTVLAETDLFVPVTRRARDALLLEGVPETRMRVCPPGVDATAFGGDRSATPDAPILSVGRLVWEKGHQDVLRAVALLHHGLARGPGDQRMAPSLVVVGAGPERDRLEAHAAELGIANAVRFEGFLPYERTAGLYSSAACLVLASLPTPAWEEQFGMVLAEAEAAGLPVLASRSGAIPEVAGDSATYFAPGDWHGLARALADPPGAGPDRAARFTVDAAAEALAAAYEEVLR